MDLFKNPALEKGLVSQFLLQYCPHVMRSWTCPGDHMAEMNHDVLCSWLLQQPPTKRILHRYSHNHYDVINTFFMLFIYLFFFTFFHKAFKLSSHSVFIQTNVGMNPHSLFDFLRVRPAGWIQKLSCLVFKLMTVLLLGWCDRQVCCTVWNIKQDGDTVDSHVTKHQWGWQDQRPRSATLTSLQLIGRYRPSQLPDQEMERGSII